MCHHKVVEFIGEPVGLLCAVLAYYKKWLSYTVQGVDVLLSKTVSSGRSKWWLFPLLQSRREMSYSSNNQIYQKSNTRNIYFKIDAFIVRGLTQTIKQERLVRDAEKYSTNVTCIQVTKISELMSIDINNNILICTETSNKHYGNGSFVSPK